MRKKEYTTYVCETCQREFEAPTDVKRRFCNQECWKLAPSEVRIRAHNGRWVPDSIWDVSPRTLNKILKRLDVCCSRCGWNEATCDLHHIAGRKVENPHAHQNLTILCPNCHRLFHCGKIGPADVKTVEEQIGDSWKHYYFG